MHFRQFLWSFFTELSFPMFSVQVVQDPVHQAVVSVWERHAIQLLMSADQGCNSKDIWNLRIEIRRNLRQGLRTCLGRRRIGQWLRRGLRCGLRPSKMSWVAPQASRAKMRRGWSMWSMRSMRRTSKAPSACRMVGESKTSTLLEYWFQYDVCLPCVFSSNRTNLAYDYWGTSCVKHVVNDKWDEAYEDCRKCSQHSDCCSGNCEANAQAAGAGFNITMCQNW